MPDRTVIFESNVPATMRDGTALRANVFRPAESGRYPVLLTRHPYNKDLLSYTTSLLNPLLVAQAGYVVIVQDARGRFASEGEFVPFVGEAEDGYDTVEWAAALPYSDGNVGMFGASYYGFTQWAAARLRPPHLRCLAPSITWSHYEEGLGARGGAHELGLTVNWTHSVALTNLGRKLGKTPAFLAAFAQMVAAQDRLGRDGYWDVPLLETPSLRAHDTAPWFFERLEGGVGSSLSEQSPCTFWQEVSVPAYNIGGWYDCFLGGTLANYTGMQRTGQGDGRRQKLLLTPWAHGVNSNFIGQLDFGIAASPLAIDLRADVTALHLRWFDYWLKGAQNGVLEEPPVKLFVMGENKWRDEREWPLARTRYTPWYLHSGGEANSMGGNGRLSPAAPGAEPADHYLYDPTDPVPTVGGNTLLHGKWPAGPRDQNELEWRQDVLVYTSENLEQDLEVTGPVSVTLWVGSDAPDTDFVARLVDVWPDGTAINLCDGIVCTRHRSGLDRAEWMEPGQAYEIKVDLWATSNLFKAGHRLRLDVTSSSFPRWHRNANTTEDPTRAVDLRPAQQTVFHDGEHPSHVLLPIIPR